MPVDLSDMAAVDKFAEEVLKKYGCIDVLVNNAAILGPISYEGDATKNPNMGQGPIDGEGSSHHYRHLFLNTFAAIIYVYSSNTHGIAVILAQSCMSLWL